MAGRRLCGCGRGADAETSKRMLDLAVAGKAFERFREEEVDKAVRALAREKVTRPDGFSAGDYQHLSARIPAITILRNPIIITGEIRETLVQLHKAPLEKPRRVRTACSSKKLICLKNAASKALESGVMGRIHREVEAGRRGRANNKDMGRPEEKSYIRRMFRRAVWQCCLKEP